MNGIAKIYPAKELKAVDMAELMKASLLFNGVLHGCAISIDNNRLRMTPGRIVIFGRLASFEGSLGENYLYFDAPSVSARTKFMICAICDLNNPSNSFYISLLGPSAYSNLVAEVDAGPTDEKYNIVGGKRFIRLGEVYYDGTGTPSSLNVSATDYPSGQVNSNQLVLKNHREAVNEKDATYMAWIRYLNKARHHRNFFKTNTVTIDGVLLPATTSGLFWFRKEIDAEISVVNDSSGSGTSSISIPVGTPHTILSRRYAYKGPGTNGIIGDGGAGESISPIMPQEYDHGAPVNIGESWVHFGIVGVQIDNANSGGSGATSCVLQGFYMYPDGDHIAVRVRNLSSSQALIMLKVRSLYIRDIELSGTV